MTSNIGTKHFPIKGIDEMRNDPKRRGVENVNDQQDLPAGDFFSWLRHTRRALFVEDGTPVDCGGCNACCRSSYFIHIRPEETRTLGRIHKDLFAAAPGLPKGHVLLGYDKNGYCPMQVSGRCSIYEHCPLTCRNYDCRVFTAAGIAAGGDDKARITQRARRWKFNYPTKHDHDEHSAVQAAATFIQEHTACFPGGAIPSNPSQLAILAIKVSDVFLKHAGGAAKIGRVSLDIEVANAIVEACRKFDARRDTTNVPPRVVFCLVTS
jgi:Fe-S-cluster containining protein